MQTTYTVSRGQQYDRGGISVEYGRLYSAYNADGRYSHGDGCVRYRSPEVAAAVARVLAGGPTETVVVGVPDAVAPEAPEAPGRCQECGTYCYGDCRS